MVDWHRLFHECIAGIWNPGSEFMHSRDSNVDSERVIICQWTVGFIKINTFNLRAPIWTVAWNKIPFIITVTFLILGSMSEQMIFFPSGRDLIGMGAKISLKCLSLSYCRNKASFNNFLWVFLNFYQWLGPDQYFTYALILWYVSKTIYLLYK